jgi:FAD/FMN-containing dehydrogenase/Fe-S oxidoreductase
VRCLVAEPEKVLLRPWRCEDDQVLLFDDVTRSVYSTDNSIYQVTPQSVAVPSTAQEIANLLRVNAASDDPSPIVARGGGTGTNGQSLTDGITIDVKRRLCNVVSVDVEGRTAVVEPGVVTAELNAMLAPNGLFWAPHTSTLNRCTVGGMISTDAAGKGSLVHGRAHRHVLALDVLLVDGAMWRAEPVSIAEAERRADGNDSGARLWRALLDLPIDEDSDFDLPELARGFSGYGIDRLRHDGLIDPTALLTGAEGTLGVIVAATIRLTPLPSHTSLIVASYPSFDDALADAVELRDTNPSAIETFDERTLQQGRSSPAWPALDAVVGQHTGAVLLLEYEGDIEVDLGPVRDALAATGRSNGSAELKTAAERADAWKVRSDAVGLLAKVEVGAPDRSARPTAMVEDCAVPVASMCAFIADFRAALDSFGVEYGMFGHADVGCVHVRPAIDTAHPEDEALVKAITDEVVAIVARHGGVLWGEHGRGFRGDSVETFLTADTISVMRQVKTAFDPADLLNPGKLYRPVAIDEPIVAVDAPPMRGQANRAVPVRIRREFDHAFACNGNGLCHHYDGAEVMCPSYKATRDPALSPKGRADLIREWLRRRSTNDPGLADFEDGVASNLHECLSCSACTGRCPVEVNIPELKSQFLESYYSTRRRPIAHNVLARFEQLAALMSRAPRLAKLGATPAGRLLGLVDLPTPKRRLDGNLPRFVPDGPSRPDIVLLADVFTSTLEPATVEKAADVLASIGYSVELSPFVPSGKFDHVKGRRAAFVKQAMKQAELVASITAAGAVAVAIEPATALLHHEEYPAFVDGYPSADVRHLVDMISARSARLRRREEGPVAVLGHCTERANRPAALNGWREVLEAVGYDVTIPALGCCGMAGIFGHEADNQAMAQDVWNLSWAKVVDLGGPMSATGYSCRSQSERMAGAEIPHPIHLL